MNLLQKSVLAALLILPAAAAYAEPAKPFTLDLSDGWVATVYPLEEKDADGSTTMPAKVVMKKGSLERTIESADIGFEFLRTDDEERVKRTQQDVIAMEDLNFDGLPDVMLLEGRFGFYNAQSYKVYVQTRSGQFVHSPELSELMVNGTPEEIDRRRRTITVHAGRNGLISWGSHTYQILHGKKPKLVATQDTEMLEDHPRYSRKITDKTLVGGRWKTRVRYEK